ncbi:hypothetical protein T440DRAFT_422351 [Plenodomus tracheiphilus IPT5]|uniref:BRCT domain-containing protein n=1 Tax=Plenodomus tracheiphilus IPT5 TaxID=1408161 RepID=A0A6A7B852_9PLEO|nr:hypothetical protein T440DRAFT_422351 [Plenodomus tracheiphilus IPT5]
MWTLTSLSATGLENFDLPKEGSAHVLVTGPVIGVLRTLRQLPGQVELGRITVGPWGVKLEAVREPLIIVPSHPHAPIIAVSARDPQPIHYELQPSSEQRSEIIILRHSDVIRFSRQVPSLTCKWIAAEVQVDSSAADAGAADPSFQNDNAARTESETEDENLDQATQDAMASLPPKATPVPRLSNQRSIVVQETPTADRVVGTMEASNGLETNEDDSASAGDAASSGVTDSAEVDAEMYSTAHTKTSPPPTTSSPRVEIPHRSSRKRGSPAADNIDLESGKGSGSRSTKRTKRDTEDQNDTQDSRISNISIDSPKNTVIVANGKKRKSEIFEAPVETLPRSQRSSQRSNTAIPNSALYDGPVPCVAVSNSSITKASQSVKFLKKHGGSFIESVDEAFNVLCVRDGELLKTPKLLLAIARGTPIVTDKWLLESAKAGHFLNTASYIPIAPKQEKEWNIQLDQILCQPQTPFTGYTIHFTKSLKATYNAFAEMEHVCKAAGAKKTTTTLPRGETGGNSIVLAKDEGDAEMDKLVQDGITCYHKDLITQSILRGVLDLDSAEFKIETHDTPKDKKKKRQKSK